MAFKMEKTKIKKIAVHNGTFHTDDVFAVAIIKLIYPDIKIIRTRDEEKLKKVDIRIDVGRKYNPKTKDFDHHQKDFIEKRENGMLYSSTGLIWEHFGNQLINSREAFDYIDELIIQPIDAQDNGIIPSQLEIMKLYTINNLISTFLPGWKDKNPDYDKAFYDAVNFAISLMKREIKKANGIKESKEFIKKTIGQTSKEYIIFENEPLNWKEIIIDYPQIKFVIYKSSGGNWNSEGTRIKVGSFKVRKPFPNRWADLINNQLSKVTGVKDSVFCHKGLFIVVAKSKEGAIKLTELALKP